MTKQLMPCITWTIGTVMTLSQYSKINQFVDHFSSKIASTQFNPFARIFGHGSCSSVHVNGNKMSAFSFFRFLSELWKFIEGNRTRAIRA